jgi:3-oxoacyl-[acyl-carrier-protein] synthase II
MSGRRVFVSGIGVVSPYGLGAPLLRDSLFAGRSAIGPIRAFDPSRYPVHFGGEIAAFDLSGHFEDRELSWISRLTSHAVIAAREAFAEAGIVEPDAERSGVAFGSGFGSLAEAGIQFQQWAETGESVARPTTIPVFMLNAPPAQIAMRLGLRGPSFTVSTACSSASNAIGLAFQEIRSGRADVMLAGGGECALTEAMLACWCRMRVLSRRNDAPEKASRPFDRARDGMVVADATVMFVLESEEALARRGGRARAELAGFAANCDASHLTAPVLETEVAVMKAALRDAGVSPADVDLVCAHGTATRLNDTTEGKALAHLFAGRERPPALAAVKAMTGHSMGASGAIGTAAATFALESGRVLPPVNLDDPDPECSFRALFESPATTDPKCAMVNAFAFGGQNAVLVLRRS